MRCVRKGPDSIPWKMLNQEILNGSEQARRSTDRSCIWDARPSYLHHATRCCIDRWSPKGRQQTFACPLRLPLGVGMFLSMKNWPPARPDRQTTQELCNTFVATSLGQQTNRMDSGLKCTSFLSPLPYDSPLAYFTMTSFSTGNNLIVRHHHHASKQFPM